MDMAQQENRYDEQDGLLLDVSLLKTGPVPRIFEEHRGTVDALMNWIDEYLCQPHPELGRSGPVCPFVPTSLEKKLFNITIYSGPHLRENLLHEILLEERDRFLAMEPTSGNEAQFKTILILFPNIPEDEVNDIIEMAQADLQSEFVPHGLMVGEFHPGTPDKPALWNEKFKPLYCPVPLLAIRHMVPTDILFLKDERSLITEYLRLFGDMVPTKFRKYIEEAAERFGFDMPDEKSKAGSSSVIYHLEKNKTSYKVHRHECYDRDIKAPRDFAEALGYSVDRISKTLFLCDKTHQTYLMVVCGAEKSVNLEVLAALVGVPKLILATPNELREKVGYLPRAVTLIGVKGMPAYVDADLMAQDTILIGAGEARMEVEIAPADLVKISNAQVEKLIL